jgi:hypothetical protein
MGEIQGAFEVLFIAAHLGGALVDSPPSKTGWKSEEK